MVSFTHRQIEERIEIWFENAAGVIDRGLVEELRKKPQINELAKNPLLLPLICRLYQEKGSAFPTRRSQFYREAVDCMLGKWHTQHSNQQVDENWVMAKTRLLKSLAYQFSCEGKEVFSLQVLKKKINQYLQSGSENDFRNKTATELIRELCEKDKILRKFAGDGGSYCFLERTFQEYLTASYLNQLFKHDLEEGLAEARKHFWNFNWHETLSLMTGLMDDPIPLLEAITQEKDDIFWSMLLLAGQCIAECEESSHPLIVEVIDNIYELWRSHIHYDFVRDVIVILGRGSSAIRERLQNTLEENYIGYYAIEALGKIGSPDAIPALISAFQQLANNVRFDDGLNTLQRQVVKALGNIGTTESAATLISLLQDSPRKWLMERRDAAEALGKIGTPEAISALLSVLLDDEWQVRKSAAEALGKIGTPEAITILTSALESPDEEVRRTAAVTLGHLGRAETIPTLINALHRDPTVSDLAVRALGNIGTLEVVPALISAFQNSKGAVIWEAIHAMGKVGGSKAITALLFILKDNSIVPWYREYAARSLGNLGRPEAVDTLNQLLYANGYDSSDFQAVDGLEKIGTPEAISALSKAFQSFQSDFFVRSNPLQLGCVYIIKIAKILGKLGRLDAINFLITALQDPTSNEELNDYIGEDAAEALGEIGTLETLEQLLQLFLFKDFIYFSLIRKLAIRYCMAEVPFIPVYPEVIGKRRLSHTYRDRHDLLK